MNAQDFINDIPPETARRAYSGISFSPEKRAEQTRNGYTAELAADYEGLQKGITPDKQATLDAEFARYREGYKRHYLDYLSAKSRCVSWMIAGPANFPVRQQEKRFNTEHKRLEELLEFRKRAVSAIAKTLHPELRPIMSGDSDAVDRLKAEIDKAEKQQERMKTANALIRKHFNNKPEGVSALQAVGWTEEQSRELLTKPDCFGGYGFAHFELTNNNANIRRMKQRLVMLERNKQAVKSEIEGTNARIEDSPAENRIRLFYPGKPAEDVRSRLKSNGFRWTPSLGCWQAYRNHSTLERAKIEAGLDKAA